MEDTLPCRHERDGLDLLRFDNRFVRDLPADPLTENRPRQVAGAAYTPVAPTEVSAPRLIAYARETAELIDLCPADCESDRFARIFTGNELLPGMQPYATVYGGHQFGQWAGQLGDGRAINLGDVVNRQGQRWALQLKGAGPTPYRRMADGLAVLRSSIREFLCSEAMHHLGVATTRALSLTLTGEQVWRDMFYDGHPKLEPGAVVCRVAPSFTRFGHFQIHAARNDITLLKKLADHTLAVDFPHLGNPSPETYIRWFQEVCRTTADMIVAWMGVGFVHGVMNTDNMSILGLTIDYGPYGWLDNYDPAWTPNTTDAQTRRYCFGNQPGIAQWNLAQFAGAIHPLINRVEPLQEALDAFTSHYQEGWRRMMARKLGLSEFKAATDEPLVRDLFDLLAAAETDMTLFFRRLADIDLRSGDPHTTDQSLMAPLMEAYYTPEELTPAFRERTASWLRRYLDRAKQDNVPQTLRRQRMNAVNPKYVLRNYLAQQAIDKAETGDYSHIHELLDLVRRPYDEQPDKESFAQKRPDWARNRPGCSMLSCSS